MSGANHHPISLEQVVFTKVNIAAVRDYVKVEGAIAPGPVNTINVDPIPDLPGKYQAVMRTVVEAKGRTDTPYDIDVECIGILSADNSLSADKALRGVMITAHSVLYGAIRETVSWLTSRQPHGLLMLGLSVLGSADPEPKTDS